MSPQAHDQDRLLEYAYGELAPPEAKSFEAHLQSCAECARALEDIRSVRRTMGQLPTVPAPNAGLDSLLAYAQQAARRAQAGPESRSSFWKWLLLPGSGALALVLLIVVTRQVEGTGQIAQETSRARTLTKSSEAQQLPAAEEPAALPLKAAEKKAESDQIGPVAAPAAASGAKENAVARSDVELKLRREFGEVAAPKPTAPPARKAAPPAALAKNIAPSDRDKDLASEKGGAPARADRLTMDKSAAVAQSSESEAGGAVTNLGAASRGAVSGALQGQGAPPAMAARSANYKQPQSAADEEIARVRKALATENPMSAERAKLLSRLCELLYAAKRSAEAESACDQVIREFPGSPAAITAQELKAKNLVGPER